MAFTQPPDLPDRRTDTPQTFSEKADGYFAWMSEFVTELNEAWPTIKAVGVYGIDFVDTMSSSTIFGTSSTNITLGTGVKTLTTQSGLGFAPGHFVAIRHTSNPSDNYMLGTVLSYVGTTLTCDIYAYGGSGTYTSWAVYVQPNRTPLYVNAIAPEDLSDGDVVWLDDRNVVRKWKDSPQTVVGGTGNLPYHNAFCKVSDSKAFLFFLESTSIKYCAITISNGSLQFGSVGIAILNSAGSVFSATYDSVDDRIVLVWRNTSDNLIYASVGTIDGSTISFGTGVSIDSSASSCSYVSCVYHPEDNRIVVFYSNSSVSKSAVGTVSESTITFGSPVVFYSGQVSYISSAYEDVSKKVIVAYTLSGSPKSKVGTVSGNTISFGSEIHIGSGSERLVVCCGGGKVVFAYNDNYNFYAIAGNVSGTTISLGTRIIIDNTNTYTSNITYDAQRGCFIVLYQKTLYGTSFFATKVVVTEYNNIIVTGRSRIIDMGAYRVHLMHFGSVDKYLAAFYDSNTKLKEFVLLKIWTFLGISATDVSSGSGANLIQPGFYSRTITQPNKAVWLDKATGNITTEIPTSLPAFLIGFSDAEGWIFVRPRWIG